MKPRLLILIALHLGTVLHAQPADLILRNGKVVLVDKNFRVEEAMAVRDGRVQAVGSHTVPSDWRWPASPPPPSRES